MERTQNGEEVLIMRMQGKCRHCGEPHRLRYEDTGSDRHRESLCYQCFTNSAVASRGDALVGSEHIDELEKAVRRYYESTGKDIPFGTTWLALATKIIDDAAWNELIR